MRFAISLALSLSLSACMADQVEPSESDDNADDTGVEYRSPEAPTPISLGTFDEPTTTSLSIAFGQCEEGDPPEGVGIEINCGNKWSELGWLSISDHALSSGQTSLRLDIALATTVENDSIRLSVHALNPDGSMNRVLSEPSLFDGDSVEVALDPGTEHYIFVARGEAPYFLWRSGVIEVEIGASAQ